MRRRFSMLNFALLLLLLVSTAACGGQATTSHIDPLAAPPAEKHYDSAPSSGGASGALPPAGTASSGPAKEPAVSDFAPGMGGTGDASTGGGGYGSAAAEATTTTAAAAPTAGEDTLKYGTTQSAASQQPITAGKVNDNADFPAYLDYIHSYQGPTVHPVAVDQRMFIKVVDADQHPVAGAQVQLFDDQKQVFDGTTVSDGTVLFFPSAAGASQVSKFRAVVSRGQSSVTAGDLASTNLHSEIVLKGATDNTGPVHLDLVFLLDATGSMGDEIDRIKGTVGTIATRIEQLPGSSRPRFGLVAYRDRGDDYITRSWNFTDNVQQFSQNLANVQAGGGGDDPESVNAGLNDAIHLQGWSDNSAGRHLRMIVLVGDAPPHLDYANDYEYTGLLTEAVAAGIKVFPIGASGLPDQGEYIFRQFAEITQGQFVFLTYANGVSGAPGVATDHHVSNFTVSDLDSLVVNLVAGEIANQTGSNSGSSEQPLPAFGNGVWPVAPEKKPVVAGFVTSVAEAVQAWLNDTAGWLLVLGLPALLLLGWMRKRNAQGDLQREDLSSVDFELTPGPTPTTNLSSEDLTAAARLATSEAARVSAPFASLTPYTTSSSTYPATQAVLSGVDIQPAPAQSTMALSQLAGAQSIEEW